MTNKESLREKLSQMISDTVWEVTDGGQKIDSKRFLTYQDEPVRSFEDIVDFFWNEIEQIRKSDMERVEKVIKDYEYEIREKNDNMDIVTSTVLGQVVYDILSIIKQAHE